MLPKTLVVPKVDTAAQLEWVCWYLPAVFCSFLRPQAHSPFLCFPQLFETAEYIISKSGKPRPQLALVTQVESPIGLLNLRSICEVDRSDSTSSQVFIHECVAFGGDDFAASIGAEIFFSLRLKDKAGPSSD